MFACPPTIEMSVNACQLMLGPVLMDDVQCCDEYNLVVSTRTLLHPSLVHVCLWLGSDTASACGAACIMLELRLSSDLPHRGSSPRFSVDEARAVRQHRFCAPTLPCHALRKPGLLIPHTLHSFLARRQVSIIVLQTVCLVTFSCVDLFMSSMFGDLTS